MAETTGDDARSVEEIENLRGVLLVAQAESLAQLTTLTRDFDDLVAASTDVAIDDEHDPEGATIAFERAQVAALQQHLVRHLAAIEMALADLRDGTYGRCERCGLPIAAERLAVRPAARRCIACASS